MLKKKEFLVDVPPQEILSAGGAPSLAHRLACHWLVRQQTMIVTSPAPARQRPYKGLSLAMLAGSDNSGCHCTN